MLNFAVHDPESVDLNDNIRVLLKISKNVIGGKSGSAIQTATSGCDRRA